MKHYAQIDAGGMCSGLLSTSGEVDAPHMIAIAGPGAARIGQRWTGAAWVDVVDESAKAEADLRQIDADTGMSRTMREAIIAIADKVGADAAFLKGKEAAAAAARLKVKK